MTGIARDPKDDRRARILDAALDAFADKGFDAASTNTIAETAGVAKGLVFHHFGSKEQLFLAVVDDVIATLMPAFEAVMADAPPDLFARVLSWSDAKLRLLQQDPRRLRFLLVAMVNAPDDLRQAVRERGEALLVSFMPRLVEGVDENRLRPGTTTQEALEAVMLLSAGIERMILPLFLLQGDALNSAVSFVGSRVRRLLELLRDGVYRHSNADDETPRKDGVS